VGSTNSNRPDGGSSRRRVLRQGRMSRRSLHCVSRVERLREIAGRLHPSSWLYSTYEHRLIAELDHDQLPQHVAVLADGNRRWARANAPGQPLAVGYRAGADRLKEFVEWCDEVRIPVVTLWVLSTENFARDAEVLRRAEDDTRELDGMMINIAVSYGGRHELRDAFRSLLAEKAKQGMSITELAETLEIDHIADHLYTAGQPDPDLIIRTSGEQRLSGFLMWQSAHSEFYFCEALWPDFRKVDFVRALRAYIQRERRFGR
jgi:short-chain Z-isoprenyl diphosphate synthase